MKLCFLLAKDPTSENVGDTAMMNQLLRLARDNHDVSVICWSERPDLGDDDRAAAWFWRGPCRVE